MTPGQILVIKPSSLGDVVHTLPAVHCLKRQWPQVRIRWVINPEWACLLEGNPDVDEVIQFPRRSFRGVSGLQNFWHWSKTLSEPRPDLALDFQGLLRSALMSLRSKADVRLGLSDAREGARWFVHDTAAVGSIDHAVDRYLALAKRAGADVCGAVEFPLPDGSEPSLALPGQPFVVLHPYARGSGKALLEEESTQLAQALQPMPVVVVGSAKATLSWPNNVTNAVNATTLPELLWLLRRAAYTISVDSGPMHIAAAFGGRVLAIHTWSDPKKVGPYPPECAVWKGGHIANRLAEFPNDGPVRPDKGQIKAIASYVQSQWSTARG